jgi:GNAT superfamily N-acetyltransferase
VKLPQQNSLSPTCPTGYFARHMTAPLLTLYDRELREDPPHPGPGYRIERTAHVTRFVGPTNTAPDNCIIFSRLDERSADAAIAAEIAYFGAAGRDFEWKLYDHDRPADLAQRLLARGFIAETPETVLVREVAAVAPPRLADPAISIRRLRDPAELAVVTGIQNMVWNDDHAWVADSLARELTHDPEALEILIAEAGATPSACSWMRCQGGTQFASLWGAATLPDYRGRGLYSALVARHAATAREHGFRLLTVDANANSRPVLEKVGFRALTGTRPYVWHVAG